MGEWVVGTSDPRPVLQVRITPISKIHGLCKREHLHTNYRRVLGSLLIKAVTTPLSVSDTAEHVGRTMDLIQCVCY